MDIQDAAGSKGLLLTQCSILGSTEGWCQRTRVHTTYYMFTTPELRLSLEIEACGNNDRENKDISQD